MTPEIKKHIKGLLTSYLILSCILGTFTIYALICLVGIQNGDIPTSTGNSQTDGGDYSKFYLKVAANGESAFTNVVDGGRNLVSEELEQHLLSTTFPNPDVAMHDALGHSEDRGFHLGTFFGLRPAEAHATKLCTRDVAYSNQTGGSWERTNWRYDSGGYRYTVTYHFQNSYPAPLVTAKFYGKINKRYC